MSVVLTGSAITSNKSLKPNPANLIIVEDFIGGVATAGTIGGIGFFLDAIGSTPLVTGVQAAYPNFGVIQYATAVAATAGQGGGLRLINASSSSGTLVNNLQGSTGWELQWIFKLSQTTNTRFRIGVAGSDTTIVPGNGLSCRYDTNATFGDTTFVFESTVGSVVTQIDSGIAVDTNWHRVKITSLVAGTAIFTLYDASGKILATKSLTISFVTASGMSPIAIIATDATAQKSIQLDYVSMFYPNIAR